MKIISIKGGLGNQMFGYATYLALRQKYPFLFVSLELTEIWNEHNSRDIIKVFNHLKWHPYKYYRRIQKLYSEYFTRFIFKKKEEKDIEYGTFNKNFFSLFPLFCCYSGYWQTEKYFISAERKIRNAFKFNLSHLNPRSRNISETIHNEEYTVSVHIRKGDYSKYPDLFCDIFSDGYYSRAISAIKCLFPSATFFYFSDDPDFVRTNFHLSNKDVIVDWNKGDDSWQDMYLMSICDHNIIANSTFSWWGGWLNANKHKIVIAPRNWFIKYSADNIIPESWIKC